MLPMLQTEISDVNDKEYNIASIEITNAVCDCDDPNIVEPIISAENRVTYKKDTQNEFISLIGKLNSIPTKVLHYKNLRYLDLSHNTLEQLPSEIRICTNLVSLDLSHNQLKNLPKTLADIIHLRHLDISHNAFDYVPLIIYEALQFLMIFNISFNKIEYFTECPCCLANLSELNLSHNDLKSIPKWIFTVQCKIEIFDISHNSLSELDEKYFCKNVSLKSFSYLKVLNIQNCQLNIKHLQFLSNMSSLETLILSNHNELNIKKRNYFEYLLENMEKCQSLKHLYASNVGISFLTMNIDCLINIQYLDLERNSLTWLPDSFCDLQSLKICRLGSNLLSFLPIEIGKLTNLQEIYLNNNQIAEVPDTFKHLDNLRYCDFYDNKLEYIDPRIITLHTLRGIDLECNCLDFHSSIDNQEVFEEFMVKYSTLKGHFRQKLNEVRCDFQNKAEAEVIHPEDEQFSTNSQEFDLTVNNIIYEDFDNHTENWDEEGQDISFPHNEDDFDPNVDYEKRLKLRKAQRKLFSCNFCPGDSHVPSLMKYFTRKPYKHIEGQFDLN